MVSATHAQQAQASRCSSCPPAGAAGKGRSTVRPVQRIAAYRIRASARWMTSRYGDTAVASGTKPDATMNQPTAPCSAAQDKQQSETWAKPPLDPAGCPEPDQRDDEGQPDQPAPQPMDPFQPEDLLEAGEPEALVHQAVLRDLLIEMVQPLPFRVAHRWKRARERRPFHDGKAGAGQARDAAEDDHHQDHAGDAEQPGRDQPPAATAGRAVFRRRTREFANVEGHGTP